MPVEKVRPDTVLELKSEVAGRIVVSGARNTLRVGSNVVLNATVWLQGEASVVEIADDCRIDGMIHIIRGSGGAIRIGRGTTIAAAGLSLHEAGSIVIGEDCMLSTDIHADVSDMHPIYDRASGVRLNPARSIEIGQHVWIGPRVLVIKGAVIGDGAVIGSGSVVSGTIPPNSVATGSPAKVVRENIEWRREFEDPDTPRAHRPS